MQIKQKILITLLAALLLSTNNYIITSPPKHNPSYGIDPRYEKCLNPESETESNQKDDITCCSINDFDPGLEAFTILLLAIIWILYPPKLP